MFWYESNYSKGLKTELGKPNAIPISKVWCSYLGWFRFEWWVWSQLFGFQSFTLFLLVVSKSACLGTILTSRLDNHFDLESWLIDCNDWCTQRGECEDYGGWKGGAHPALSGLFLIFSIFENSIIFVVVKVLFSTGTWEARVAFFSWNRGDVSGFKLVQVSVICWIWNT